MGQEGDGNWHVTGKLCQESLLNSQCLPLTPAKSLKAPFLKCSRVQQGQSLGYVWTGTWSDEYQSSRGFWMRLGCLDLLELGPAFSTWRNSRNGNTPSEQFLSQNGDSSLLWMENSRHRRNIISLYCEGEPFINCGYQI